MNRNITRGLALAALTGGFTILGATAANAIDLPDLGGGTSGSGLLGNGGLLGTGIDLGGTSTGTGGILDDLLVDLGDTTTDLGTDLGAGDVLGAFIGAPIDLSDAWVSLLGEDPNGIVIVPDLTIDLSVLTGGLITSEILAPISLDCVTITILSDYERDCGRSTIDDFPTDPENPTDPTTPTTPVVVGGDNGDVNNGGTNDTEGITDPCAVVPTVATTELTSAQPVNLAVFGAAALAGALAAMLLMLLGRRLGRQQQ